MKNLVMKKIAKKNIEENNHQHVVTNIITSYIIEIKHCLDSLDKQKIANAVEMVLFSYRAGKTIYIIGNGGSASTATHMSCDLAKGTLGRVYNNREKRLQAVSLTDNISLITAYANDLSYNDVFVQQLQNLVKKNDLLIVMSGSGNSKNILKAVKYVKKYGVRTIGLLGFKSGGEVAKLVDLAITVDSNHYGPIEDIHLMMSHVIASIVAKIKNTEKGIQKKVGGKTFEPFKIE